MRLLLTLVRADGAPEDLEVEAAPSTSIGALARAILERDPPGAGARVGVARALTLSRLMSRDAGEPEWEALPARAAIGDGRLVSGMRVAIADAPGGRETAAVDVEVISGPQRGARWTLGAGAWVVGRAERCDLVLDDPAVSARHARLEVGDGLCWVDLGSANGLEVDGVVVPRVAIEDSGVIVLGRTALRCTRRPDDGPRPEPAASNAFNRSPRVEPRYPGERLAVPAPPPERTREPLPWTAIAAPILFGVALAVVLARPVMLLFALMSPVMLLGSTLVQRRRQRRERERAAARFESGMVRLEEELRAAHGRERASRLAEAPSSGEVVEAAGARSELLWTRRTEHTGFLRVRLGVGALPSRTELTVPEPGALEPAHAQRVRDLVAAQARVAGLPIVEDLVDAGAIGIAGPPAATPPLVHAILAQLLGLHAPGELGVAAIATSAWARELDWLKWTPHAASAAAATRAITLTDTAASASALVTAIEARIDERLAGREPSRRGALASGTSAADRSGRVDARAPGEVPGTRSPVPALIVVVAGRAPVERERLVRISERGPDAGVFVLWLAETAAQLPASCRTVVDRRGEHEHVTVSFVRLGERVVAVEPDALDRERADVFARALAPLVDAAAAEGAAELPTLVTHRELIGDEAHDDPDAIIGRWREKGSLAPPGDAPATEPVHGARLRALVGVAGGVPLPLDLRADGPHALVGGTTGSGKSEFLQAWVLGLAVEYSPERVTFLLVDYKGGSAFADCVRLPHCVGLVTDLTPALVRRALTSLGAELRLREALLNQRGAKDLVELERRGDPATPPALVIVIDELAALAKDVPEFIEGLIDLAQRGRSLGIHLVLATQRPAGVIRDDVRANTSVRIALRMADPADSRDVIGTPDAAQLDAGLAGRAFVRIGAGRPVAFQSAYSGGRATSEPRKDDIRVAALRFGPALAWSEPAQAARAPTTGPTDQQRLVETVVRAATKRGLPPPRRPWLDELPSTIGLSELPIGDETRIPLGVGDEPERQRRVTAWFRPDVDGHIAFYGTGGSGKTTALRALAAATVPRARRAPVHVYGLDFAGGGLLPLEALPHVGAIVPGSDAERVERLLARWRDELVDRGARYSALGAGDIGEYRRLAGRPDEPRLLLLLDGFAAFREFWDRSLGRAGEPDVIAEVLAQGRRLGLHIALSADRPGAVPSVAAAGIQRRVVLRLADSLGYTMLGVAKDGLADDAPPGRAIVDRLETQLAVAALEDASPDGIERAPGDSTSGTTRHGAGPPPIGALPSLVPAHSMPASIHGLPVLGVAYDTLQPIGFEPRGIVLLAGPHGSGRSGALEWLVGALERGARPELVYFGSEASALSAHGSFAQRAERPEDVAALADELLDALERGRAVPIAVVVEGVADLAHTVAERALVELARRLRRGPGLLIAEQETAGWSSASALLGEIKNARRGLLLRPDAADGELLLRTPLPRAMRPPWPPGRGCFIEHGRVLRVQVPHMAAGTPSYPQSPPFVAPRSSGAL